MILNNNTFKELNKINSKANDTLDQLNHQINDQTSGNRTVSNQRTPTLECLSTPGNQAAGYGIQSRIHIQRL